MKRIVLLLSALALGACATPHPTAYRPKPSASDVLRAIFVEPYPYSVPAYAGAYVPTYVGSPCYP